MSERIVVLDSSAMLAIIKDEPGADAVRALLRDESVTTFAHAVNLAEVVYDFGPQSNLQNQQKADALRLLVTSGVVERQDMDGEFWRDIAFLIAERRAQAPRLENLREKPRLALGDAFRVALARRLDAPFVTADRTEIEPLQSVGMGRAEFIR